MIACQLRSIAFTVVVSLSLFVQGCGKDEGSSAGGDNNNESPGLVNSPNDPASCNRAWNQFVASNPRGMKLTYESRAMGYQSTYSSEVIESNSQRVTLRTTTQGEDNETSTTREDFLTTCKSGVAGNNDDIPSDPGFKVEERRKENRVVRAGNFMTDYIRLRNDRIDDEEGSSIVSESWTATGEHNFLVYQRSITSFDGNTFESTSELIEIRRP
jgi:hypothetical protein